MRVSAFCQTGKYLKHSLRVLSLFHRLDLDFVSNELLSPVRTRDGGLITSVEPTALSQIDFLSKTGTGVDHFQVKQFFGNSFVVAKYCVWDANERFHGKFDSCLSDSVRWARGG